MSIELPDRLDHQHLLPPGELAALIAEYGICHVEPEVSLAVDAAEACGAPERLVRLTRDRLTPAIVRERAFGRLAAYLPVR